MTSNHTEKPHQNQFNRLISGLGYLGLLPFIVLTLQVFFPSIGFLSVEQQNIDTLFAFRLFSAVILSFIAGSLWAFGAASSVGFALQNPKIQPVNNGLIWGSVLIILAGWGVLFLVAKAGVFVAALLYLVLWQIEQKTNLTKVYPIWYSELRVKLTMLVVICHISIWMTLS